MEEIEFDSEIVDKDEGGFEEEEEYEEEVQVSISPSSTMDFRLLWIRDRVLKFLGLYGMNHLFNDLLSKNERQNETDLLDFLTCDTYGVTDLSKKQVFFYKTYRSETIQEEVSVWEESHRKITAIAAFATKSRPQRLTKSAPGKVEKQDERKKEKKPKKGKKVKGKKEASDLASSAVSAITGSTMSLGKSFHSILAASETGEEGELLDHEEEEGRVETPVTQLKKKSKTKSDSSLEAVTFLPPPGDEDKYILTKKVVDKVVEVPVLHIFFGEIDVKRNDLHDINLIYFMRTNEEGTPVFNTLELCSAEMPSYFVVGSLNGQFLQTLNRKLTYVFKPLVEKQFRGPGAALRLHTQEIFSSLSGSNSEKLTSALQTVAASQASAFMRPSDYRRISLAAVKLKSKVLDSEEQKDFDRILEKQETTTNKQKKELIRNTRSKDINPSQKQSDVKKFDSMSCKSQRSIQSTSIVPKSEEIDEVPIEPAKKDLLDYLNKLTASVEWSLDHIESDVLLTIPKLPELTDPEISDVTLSSKREIIEQLEEAVGTWGKHIQKTLDTYAKREPKGNGPMAEYDDWRDRETALSVLVEQLKTPIVQRILSILKQGLSIIGANFDYFQKELWKHYAEARDNNKFLFTVLRYFKLIDESDSFETIADAIPLLMNGIRMMWVLSKYYSIENKLVPLLERISWQLCQNVTKNLSVKTLFKRPLEEVLQKTQSAHKMTKKWKATYLETRRNIEESGKGVRWEFDQRRLFKETEYISSVCKDLNTIASVMEDFYNIFGAELKSIINDPTQIDAIVKRVGKLILPIQEADFNIFSEFNRENWEATMNWFNGQVLTLENDAKSFIDECFTVLRSAEEALYMLVKFKKMKTRAAIQDQLSKKFDVIMQQFSKEIGSVEDIFNQGKGKPPLLGYPPIAGAIFWERQLFHRLKDPVLLFQNVEELKKSDLKLFAFKQYMELAKHMKSFEETKFFTWLEKAQFIAVNSMKQSILTIESGDGTKIQLYNIKKKKSKTKERSILTTFSNTASKSIKRNERLLSKFSFETGDSAIVTLRSTLGRRTLHSERKDSKPDNMQDDASKQFSKIESLSKDPKLSTLPALPERKERKITWAEMMQEYILIERHLKFKLNFDLSIFEIIREAELLEQLGFELPAIVRDISFQKIRLHEDKENTEKMVNQYNEILGKLDEVDIQLLKNTLRNMEKYMQPGVTRLNWHSLGIKDYASACNKLLKTLISLVSQVDQIKADLENRINFQVYNLCSTAQDPTDPAYELQTCRDYFNEVETKRTEVTCTMSKVYGSITPLLIKLESLVEETSTGKSESMKLFYEKYEYKIFDGFVKCFIKNLELMNNQLSGNTPLFTVEAILLASEVVLRPSATEIFTIILHDVRDLMDRAKNFPRWKRGTCLPCKSELQFELEMSLQFHFYEDIMNIQLINNLIKNIQDTAQRISTNCFNYLLRWKKYSNIWYFDKRSMCEKFVNTSPTLQKYDEKFTFYGTIINDISEMKKYYDLGSIRINLKPVLQEISEHASEWKNILGKYLLEETHESMINLKTKIDNYRKEIELVISGLDRFKIIMQAIADIKKMAIQAEVQYRLYQETFRTLKMHQIMFDQEDENMAYKLQEDWESLYFGALYRATTLESTKDRFCEMTIEQIEDFSREFLEFAEDFEKNGPGSVGDDLDRGMKMMGDYGKRIEALEEKRLDLVNAEILFDLEPTNYTFFLNVKRDYEGMELLYKLYKQQKNARDIWSKTLWVDLNPQQLMDGMDGFLKEFRKLPKAFRALSVGLALEKTMKDFRNSVPLFVELKNEAMRERHWQELMDKTGKHFDMSPDRSEEQ